MAMLDWVTKIGQEFTVESIVEVLKGIRGDITKKAGEEASKSVMRKVGGMDVEDEQLFADGVTEAITPADSTTNALLTPDEYGSHLARVLKTVHEEKMDTYRQQCLSYAKDNKPDPTGTARNITTHVRMSDTTWQHHVAFHNLDAPMFPVSIQQAISDTQAEIKTYDNKKITWGEVLNPLKWFTL